jgi:non-lysosomal glucosylceramidase
VARDFADLLLEDDRSRRRHRWDASLFPLNPHGACPHDLGGPGEDPFVVPNSYTYRDSTIWKDLNSDFVLCVFREGRRMDRDWRMARFPAVRAAIDHLQQFDRDGDGLIENDGTPDQTFDNIPMTGPSSYCGGLWITALLAGAKLAAEACETALAREWREQAEAAKAAFNARLYNGAWYRVDTDGLFSEACFIEQLFGPFLARRLGLGDIVPEEHARSALGEIYRRNFLEAGGGEGAVSLTGLSDAARSLLPHQDDPTFQTAEIQPGFNFSLAAQLAAWGLHEEADHLRRALYHQLYEERNLVFQTPAAFDRSSLSCRAVLNMRPLAAWWIAPFA